MGIFSSPTAGHHHRGPQSALTTHFIDHIPLVKSILGIPFRFYKSVQWLHFNTISHFVEEMSVFLTEEGYSRFRFAQLTHNIRVERSIQIHHGSA
jgi:hypothetical protein